MQDPIVNPRESFTTSDHPLIVQSHLRWDFVWQRPQQLMSRFAETALVLFIEEPVYLDDTVSNRVHITSPSYNILRAVPMLSADLRGDYDRSAAVVRALVQGEIGPGGRLEGKFNDAVQWFYTPMPAEAMLGAFNESGVVYDCMDELSQFKEAPRELVERERLLLANADLVFTGGYKLFKAKAAYHDNVHFFGCGVDVSHFGKAGHADTTIPADARFAAKVAGYFGVIDERLDYHLIESLAAQRPELEIVMVGPTAKVDPADLPDAPNIHWLGQRPYEELPRYVKAFDVCLMPFALNEATEYINPTKTLEYMAAGKPIVSTAVADVVRNFTPIVTIAHSADQFVAGVWNAITVPDGELIELGREMAARSSWDSTVMQMRSLIDSGVDEATILTDLTATDSPHAIRGLELPGI